MPQGKLPFRYKEDRREFGVTGLAGLPVYMDLAQVMKLSDVEQSDVAVGDGGGVGLMLRWGVCG